MDTLHQNARQWLLVAKAVHENQEAIHYKQGDKPSPYLDAAGFLRCWGDQKFSFSDFWGIDD